MTIEFPCPHCTKLLRTSDDRAGATALCPECGKPIEIPAAPIAITPVDEPASSNPGAPPTAVSEPPPLDELARRASAAIASPVTPASPQVRAKFCYACGKPLSEWVNSCPACGAPAAQPLAAHGTTEVVYAGFWIRVCAFVLDWIAFVILLQLLGRFLHFGWGGFGTFILYAVYSIAMESSEYQATVGKILMGIIVTDDQGRRLTAGRATGRFFAKFLSLITFCFGFIMAGFMPRKRALHDVIAETLVVYKNR